METQLRPSGIEELGDMSWGTHFCLFYETREDLLSFCLPFFRAGLDQHAFCLYVASEPVAAEDAHRAMRQAFPDFERRLAEGQLEIAPHSDWYLKDGHFDEQCVLQGWLDKLDQARSRGFAGLRFAANILLQPAEWDSFARYEGKMEHTLRDTQIEGLCAYDLNRYSAANALDIIRHHQFTLARREGRWEHLEGAALKRAHDQVVKLNAELERRVQKRTAQLGAANEQLEREIAERKQAEEALRKSERVLREAEELGHTGTWEQDLLTGEIFNTEENLRLFFGDDRSKGTPFNDYAQAVHPDDREYVLRRHAQLLAEGGPPDIEYRVVWPDGSVHVIFGRATVVRDESGRAIRVYGTNVDITERKRAEAEIRRNVARMEALAGVSQALAHVGLDVQAMCETLVRYSAEVIGDAARISVLSDDGQRFQPVAFHHPKPEIKARWGNLLTTTPIPARQEWFAQLLRTGQGVLIPAIDQEQVKKLILPEYVPYLEQGGVHSILLVPLRVEGRVIGSLFLSRDQPERPYTADDQVLLQDLADRAGLTIQNAQLFQSVNAQRDRLRGLSAQVVEAQETERRAVARELHDEIGQLLYAVSANLEAVQLSPEARPVADQLAESGQVVDEALRQIRDLALELRPSMLDDFGLVPAVAWLVERQAQRAGFQADFAADPPELRLPPALETTVYRIVQAALTNVARHASAKRVHVRLWRRDGAVEVLVSDDGVGFDVAAARERVRHGTSLGLLSMEERARLAGGALEIDSAPGRGTRIRARFTVEGPSAS